MTAIAPERAPSAPAPSSARPTGDPRAGSDGRFWVAVAAIATVALAGGAVGLASRSLWMDEAMSVGASRNLVEALLHEGSSMGPYYALLRLVSLVSTEAWWLRLPSLLFAVATIPVAAAIGRRLRSPGVGLLAAALTAGSWLWLRYAQEARAYSMAMLFGTIAWYALVRTLEEPPDGATRWWRLFAAATVVAVLVHGLGILQLGAQVAVLLLAAEPTARLRRAMPVVIGAGLALMAMILPGAVEVPVWVPPLSWSQAHQLLAETTGPSVLAQVVLGSTLVAGGAVCAARFRRAGRGDEGARAMVPLAWAVIPPVGLAAASVGEGLLVPRYVIGSTVGLALLAATAVDAIPARAGRAAATALVLALLVAGQVAWHTEPHDDFRSVARHLEAEAQPGDGLFLPNPFVRPQLDYLWLDGEGAPEGLVPMVPLDPIGSLPRFYEVPDASDEELGALLVDSGVERVWILDQDAHHLETKLPDYLADPTFAATYEVAESTTYDGDLTLSLLVSR